MRRDEQGVTHVIEYTLALTLFIMLLHSFTTTMEFRLGVDLDRQDQRYPAVRVVLGELTGSVGNASGVEAWETLEWGTGETQLRNGTTVGLLASDGVLSEAKCQALAKFPYGGLREELGINEELAIEVRTLSPDAQVIFWGGDLDSASISVTEERLLLLRTTGGDEVPAKLRVSLFEAPFVSDSLYLTEIMYAPTSGTEWIELYNPHDTAIMLSGWKLSDLEEDDLITGTATEQLSIPARTAAVIASNPTIFASDYPSVSYIFGVEDSALGNGLGDTGDNLTLSYGALSYTKSWEATTDGANGDGNSLTRDCSTCDGWTATTATPGAV